MIAILIFATFYVILFTIFVYLNFVMTIRNNVNILILEEKIKELNSNVNNI